MLPVRAVGTHCAASVVAVCSSARIRASLVVVVFVYWWGTFFLIWRLLVRPFMWRAQFVKVNIGMCWNSMKYCKFKLLDCWSVMPIKMVHFPVWNLRRIIPWILICSNNCCGVSRFPRCYIERLFFFFFVVVEYVKNIGLWAVTWFMMLTENRGLSCSVSEYTVFCPE